MGLTIAAFLFAVRLRAEAVAARGEVAIAGCLGLLVGAAATLRPQYALPLGLLALVAASWPPGGVGLVRRLSGLAVGAAAATGGWMVASWRAVGTPMFPIFGGNLDPTWPANGPAVAVPSLGALLGRVAHLLIGKPGWGLALLGVPCRLRPQAAGRGSNTRALGPAAAGGRRRQLRRLDRGADVHLVGPRPSQRLPQVLGPAPPGLRASCPSLS